MPTPTQKATATSGAAAGTALGANPVTVIGGAVVGYAVGYWWGD